MKFPSVGPAFLVTAAFIGPGTVITASLAGANFGFTLAWALLFSVLATLILQEMTARLGIVTQQGLGENISSAISHPVLKAAVTLLVVSAVVIGNGAYQGGNISGASLGLESLLGKAGDSFSYWPWLIGFLAFLLLVTGSYKFIEKSLIVLVGLMSLSFIVTFILIKPDLKALFNGLFIPEIPDGATLTVIALIGTTVVPYNLFLHASSVGERWKSVEQLNEARQDLYVSIPLGGLISLAILSTAATAFFGKQISITNAADLAPALKPLFGDWAQIGMSFGLFSAGVSSAITAPLAAAYALSGILSLKQGINSKGFKAIWFTILIIGVIPASLGYKPVSIIWFAQVANGILLPVVVLILLWIMNSKKLGSYKNNIFENTLGFVVILVTLLLSSRSLMSAFGGL